jgi:hexosaminidase
MKKKGFKTNEELQTYFNGRLSELVTKHGKKMVGWDEILHPGLPKTIVVQSWRGAEALSESAQKGYDGILSDGYYLDHIRTAAFHYGVDPFPPKSTLTPEQKTHVLGGEACMWGEYVSPETIDSRIWPRVLAVAERLWSSAEVQDVDDLYRRMAVESGRLEELGLTHRSNYLPMLQRLVGEEGVKPLRVLADVVEPVKFYQRGGLRDYTSDLPLNRLVDAARPESETARVFRKSVDKALLAAPHWEELETLRPQLQEWVDNDGTLRPLLEKSKDAKEALPLSKDLSEISRLGLEALDFLKSGKSAPGSWAKNARKVLDKAQEPRAEVEIVVIPAIRKIILAAGSLDKLEKGPEDWNRFLDTQVEAAKRKTWW